MGWEFCLLVADVGNSGTGRVAADVGSREVGPGEVTSGESRRVHRTGRRVVGSTDEGRVVKVVKGRRQKSVGDLETDARGRAL